MAELTRLTAQTRAGTGTAECRRLRKQGSIPGTVYGQGAAPVAIQVPQDALGVLLRAGRRVVDVEIDGNDETAIFREVQWDTFGIQIQHFDLQRINRDEQVTVEVPLETRGTAPGVVAGGVLEQPVRELAIRCRATEIPDSITVRIGELEIGDAVHVRELELADGIECEAPPDQVVVQVVAPTLIEDEEEDELGAVGPVEPELIGKKQDDAESAD